MKRFQLIALLIGIGLLAPLGLSNGLDVLYSDTFSAQDGRRPRGWRIAEESLSEKLFWLVKDEQFHTGNGDNVPMPDGYTFAMVGAAEAAQWTDYEISCTFWMAQNNGRVILVGRWQDRDNHYAAYIDTNEGQRTIGLEKVVDGRRLGISRVIDGLQGVRIPKIEAALSKRDSHRFLFTIKGDRLEVQLDSRVYMIVNDDTFQAGPPGLGIRFNEVYFDDFIVNDRREGAGGAGELPDKVYRVAIERSITLTQANQLKKDLMNKGLQDIDVTDNGALYDVLVGRFLSQAEADRYQNNLLDQEIQSQAILEISDAGVRLPGEKDQTYKILMQIYDERLPAERLQESLLGDGYAPVSVIEAAGRYQVAVGDFNTRAEAKVLEDTLIKDGYIIAAVYESDTISQGILALGGGKTNRLPLDQIPKTIIDSPEWKRLNIEQQKLISDQIKSEIALQMKQARDEETQQVANRFATMDEELQRVVLEFRADWARREREAEEAERLLLQQLTEVDEHINKGEYAEAEDLLNIIAIDHPTEAQIGIKRSLIAFKQTGEFPEREVLVGLLGSQREGVLISTWEIAIDEKGHDHYDLALAQFTTYKSLLRDDEVIRHENVDAEITEVRRSIENIASIARRDDDATQLSLAELADRNLVLICSLGGLAGVVAVMIMMMFFSARRRRRQHQEILGQLQNVTLQPSLALGGAPQDSLPGSGVVAQLDTPGDAQVEADESSFDSMVEATEEKDGELGEEESEAFALDSADREITQFESQEEDVAFSLDADSAEFEPAPTLPNGMGESDPGHDEDTFSLGEGFSSDGDLGLGEEAPQDGERPISAKPPEPETQDLGMLDLGDLETEEAPVAEAEAPVAEAEAPAAPPSLPPEPAVEETPPATDALSDLDAPLKMELPLEPEVSPPAATDAPPAAAEAPPSLDSSDEDTLFTSPPIPDDFDPTADLGDEDTLVESPPAAAATPTQLDDLDSLPPVGTMAPTGATPVSQETPASKTASSKEFFSQNFDDEAVGGRPIDWEGDYEYATLTVSDAEPAKGQGNCLRFEKTKGDGRAYYSRTIPEAKGRLKVEFDLRCNDKNKYLLGFYIEQDQDFKRSVHTIIHRTDSQSTPMLRMQGVPIPFEMGKWFHLRYDINLVAGTLNGYADGKLVVSNTRLDNSPDCINTLAIRDNNPTIGVLLIDNLVITRL